MASISDAYWRHRIWPKERPDPKPSLDGVMPAAQIEQKVEDYLRNSELLADQWQQPITPEQLQPGWGRNLGGFVSKHLTFETEQESSRMKNAEARCVPIPTAFDRRFDTESLRKPAAPRCMAGHSRARNGKQRNNFVTFQISPPYLAVCSFNPTSLRSPLSAKSRCMHLH